MTDLIERRFRDCFTSYLSRYYSDTRDTDLLGGLPLREVILAAFRISNWRIYQTPRKVWESQDILRRNLPYKYNRYYEEAIVRIQHGQDLSEWQGGRPPLLPHSDNQKRHDKTDMLLAKYGIHHLHLGKTPNKGDRRLLFAVFKGGNALLLNVGKDHKNYDVDSLVRSYIDMTEDGDIRRMEGVVGLSGEISAADRKAALHRNVNTLIEHKGRVYCSMRLVSADHTDGTALRRADWFWETIVAPCLNVDAGCRIPMSNGTHAIAFDPSVTTLDIQSQRFGVVNSIGQFIPSDLEF